MEASRQPSKRVSPTKNPRSVAGGWFPIPFQGTEKKKEYLSGVQIERKEQQKEHAIRSGKYSQIILERQDSFSLAPPYF